MWGKQEKKIRRKLRKWYNVGNQNNIENRKQFARLRDWIKIPQRNKNKIFIYFGLDVYTSLET